MEQPKVNNTEASLKDLLDAHKKDIFFSLNCHAIATIESFNKENQTCVAKINYDKMFFEKQSNGSTRQVAHAYPILTDVPVVFLTGGKTGLTVPVQKGDQAIILFNDRDFSNWNEGASNGFVASLRLHSMSDGIAIVGLFRKTNKKENFDEDGPNLYNEESGVTIKPDKIKIYNSSDSAGALIQELVGELKDLITAIKAITVTCAAPGNPSGLPLNSAAFDAINAQLTITGDKLEGLLE